MVLVGDVEFYTQLMFSIAINLADNVLDILRAME